MNYYRAINFCTTICLISISFKAQSQNLITNNIHPGFSVSSGFLGQNYQVSNVIFTGNTIAAGQFIGTDCNLGLTDGIILTTGTVMDNGDGPHGPNNNAATGIDNGSGGYWLLDEMSGGSNYNAAVIEFDFVPLVDSISFNYVFGSDEYPEYVGSMFNDVFGFFISGPGIPGVQNIAVLSNGSAASINNVNNGMNAAHYVNNGDGSQAPQNSSPFYIQYDGFTTGLTAHKTGLQIGQAYHLIIAIADMGDGIYDSGLFIESCTNCTFEVGLNETELADFSLFPNPMSEGATLQFPESVSGNLSIYEASGRMIRVIETDENQNSIEVRGLENGVYYVCFRNNEGEILFTKRLQVLN